MSYGKILIVDDEPEILRLLDIELASEGYIVLKAQSGQEAIMKAQNSLPDLIIMDIMMPDMDGAQAIRTLKSSPKTKEIPVIFLTAILTKEEEKLKTAGVTIDNEYYTAIAKPFNPKALLNEVSKILFKGTKQFKD